MRELRLRVGVLAAFTLLFCSVYGYPTGAPDRPSTCRTLKPGHTRTSPQVKPPPFHVEVSQDHYSPGETLDVTIMGEGGFEFIGFMIEGRRADHRFNQQEIIGDFAEIKGTRVICEGEKGNGLTHTDGENGSDTKKRKITLKWTAPKPSDGHVEFRVTVVASFSEYWIAERSGIILDPNAPPLALPNENKPEIKLPMAPINLNGCGKSKGCYRNPRRCKEAECDAVVTWVDHGNHIEFELSGDADGWVAVGFSDDKLMGHDSVIECVLNEETDIVEIRQSYNRDTLKMNEVSQQPDLGLTQMESFYGNGRIKCRFHRVKLMKGVQSIFDLTHSYYILLAKGDADGKGNKEIHTLEPHKFPMVSPVKVTVADLVDIYGRARYPLVKAHGCLMIIAWMMSASLAIIMARYYKPMWPNDRMCGHRIWFAVHRGCMIVAMVCTIIGFILIFVHVGGYAQMPDLPPKAHPPLGITVTILVILNPLIAACRPNPKAGRRPLFNWFHWLFGTAGHVLATPTILIGLSLPKAFIPWWATWVMVAFLLFHVVIELLLEIHGCINARKQKQRSMEYELRKKNDARGELDGYEPEPVGTRFKTILIWLYLIVLVVLGLTMVITIAAA
jgi:hypothetical protein